MSGKPAGTITKCLLARMTPGSERNDAGKLLIRLNSPVGYALSLWGASAGVGLMIGGNATDKRGVRAVIRTTLCVLAFALASLSTLAHVLPPAIALPAVLQGTLAGEKAASCPST